MTTHPKNLIVQILLMPVAAGLGFPNLHGGCAVYREVVGLILLSSLRCPTLQQWIHGVKFEIAYKICVI